MGHSTLLVHMELGKQNPALLRLAGELAAHLNARVIGIAACQPMQIIYGDGCYYNGDIIEQDRLQIDQDIKQAETDFRAAFRAQSNGIEWRSMVTLEPLADVLAREARSADLVITGPGPGPSVDGSRRLAIGAFILQAGRPVLLVPDTFTPNGSAIATLDRVIVGWKDTSETRRAIADALPMLKRAVHVTVAELAADADMAGARARVADIGRWLSCHGIAAETLAARSMGDDSAQLIDIANERNAGLLVAGAYGHSRLREWAFGGVTHDLLLRGDRCALLSH